MDLHYTVGNGFLVLYFQEVFLLSSSKAAYHIIPPESMKTKQLATPPYF